MPRKPKSKSSVPDVPARKTGRGRPRKKIDPEALHPRGKHEASPDVPPESLSETPQLAATKANSRRMNPATSERCYTADEVEFMNALAEFKRASGRTFPTCSEILRILRYLGYEKIEDKNHESELVSVLS